MAQPADAAGQDLGVGAAVANILLPRLDCAREIGNRRVLGARQGDIVRQFLT